MSDDKPDWCRCGNFALLTQQRDGRWYCGCIRCDAEVMADTQEDALEQWSAMQDLPHPGGRAMTPKRIQLKRTRGWRMPEGTVKVDRSTRWGNPFRVSDCREAGYRGTDGELAARCVSAFEAWLGPFWRTNWDGPESEDARARILAGLPAIRGKDLACWCPLDRPCHADVLLRLANQEDAR